MLYRVLNMPGAVVATAKQCLYAIMHIENFQIKNRLNSIQKKLKQYIYAAAQKQKHRLIVMVATTVRNDNGYRN